MAPGALGVDPGTLGGQLGVDGEVLLPGDRHDRVGLIGERRGPVQSEGDESTVVLSIGPTVLGGAGSSHGGHHRAPPHEDRHVLAAVRFVRDGWRGDAEPQIPAPQLFAGVGPVGGERSVQSTLEDQVSGRGHGPRAVHPGKRDLPRQLLAYRIPCPEGGEHVVLSQRGAEAALDSEATDPRLGTPRGEVDAGVVVDVAGVDDREVRQTRSLIEGHGVPSVASQRSRRHHRTTVLVSRVGILHGPTGGQVHVARPRDLRERLGRDQAPVRAVDDVEESVLRRLHEDFALFTPDLEVREDDVHVRVVVPRLPRRVLVVPQVLARIGVQRDDGAQEEVVASVGAPDLAIPRRSVSRADIELIELGVVGESVPRVSTTTVDPPVAGPGLGRHLHGFVLEASAALTRFMLPMK